jgi:hypothetical protein
MVGRMPAVIVFIRLTASPSRCRNRVVIDSINLWRPVGV